MRKLFTCIFLFICTTFSLAMSMEKELKKLKITECTEQEIVQLFAACKTGEYNTVESALKRGFDPNLALNIPQTPVGWFGTRPLHWASYYGHAKIVDLLLHHNADVNASDENNQTSLYKAALKLQVNVVQKLLKAKATVDTCDFAGYTPLHLICASQLLETTKKTEPSLYIITMLRMYGAKNWQLNRSLSSVFHHAALLNKPELIYCLIMPIEQEMEKLNTTYKKLKKEPAIYPSGVQNISKESLLKRWCTSYVCKMKKFAQQDPEPMIQIIKKSLSEQECATLEHTLDTKNKIGSKPCDLATDPKVKALLDPKAWQ